MKFDKQDGITNLKKNHLDSINQTMHKNYMYDITNEMDLNSIVQLEKAQYFLNSYLNKPYSNVIVEHECTKSLSSLKNVIEDDSEISSKQLNESNKNGFIGDTHLKMNSLGEQLNKTPNFHSINSIEVYKNPIQNQTLHKTHHSSLSNIPMRMRKFPASFFNGDSNYDDRHGHLENSTATNSEILKNKSSLEKFTKHQRYNSSPLNNSDKLNQNDQLEHCSSLQSIFSNATTGNAISNAHGAALYKINSTQTIYKNKYISNRNDHDKIPPSLSKPYMNKKLSKRCISVDSPVSITDTNFEHTFDSLIRSSISTNQIESSYKMNGDVNSNQSQVKHESLIRMNQLNDSLKLVNTNTNNNNNNNSLISMAKQNLNFTNLTSSISNYNNTNDVNKHPTSSLAKDPHSSMDVLNSTTHSEPVIKNDQFLNNDFTKISDQFDHLFYNADFKDYQLETNEYQSALVQAMVDNAVEVLNEMESKKHI